ncbi:MAG: hypothetical protein K2M16_06675, partial [Muribaculaceae bacterium]|nr:hypothetical protein [Muribaculaceae bacterium]
MKTYRIILFSLAAASLMSATSCTSDKNPFDITVTPIGNESNVANIRLNLDVASTRAEDDLSTDAEKKINKVSIYVFDENNNLELFKRDISVSSDSPAEIEVTPGLKTLYVVASKTMISESISEGTTLSDFEETVFSSTIADLKTADGFVMVGKSEPQQVLKS